MEKTLLFIVLVPIFYGAYIIYREFKYPVSDADHHVTSAGTHLIQSGIFMAASPFMYLLLVLSGVSDPRLLLALSGVSLFLIVYNVIMAGVKLNEANKH